MRFHRHLLYAALWLAAGTYVSRAQTEKLTGLQALLDGSGFVTIRPGQFLMGSASGNQDEAPVHRIRIRSSFEMGKYEVTQAQWDTVMRRAHAVPGDQDHLAPSRFKGEDLPVESVSWPDVQEFLKRLNARDPKYVYRLPTEAEWEFACRGGSKKDDIAGLENRAWFEHTSGSATHDVGQKQPNSWGLYDMQGNVAEWTSDWYGPYPGSGADGSPGPGSGSYRVFRGGAWLSEARQCRCASRGFNFPNDGYDSVGFRLVRTKR